MPGLTKAENVEVDLDGYPKDWSRYWRAAVVRGTEFAYPGRAAGLEQDAVYEYTDNWDFVAGMDKTYRAWRDTLARLAGYESAKAVVKSPTPPRSPFVELIDFFDSGGMLGTVVCAKLARGFAAFKERARAVGGGFYALYYVWEGALEATAGNGVLVSRARPNPTRFAVFAGVPTKTSAAIPGRWSMSLLGGRRFVQYMLARGDGFRLGASSQRLHLLLPSAAERS